MIPQISAGPLLSKVGTRCHAQQDSTWIMKLLQKQQTETPPGKMKQVIVKAENIICTGSLGEL